MKKIILFISVLLLVNVSFAQKTYWYFGKKMVFDASGQTLGTWANHDSLVIKFWPSLAGWEMAFYDSGGVRKFYVDSLSYLHTMYLFEADQATDHTGNGFAIRDTVGENVSENDVLYIKNDGKYWKADCDASTTMTARALALETITADNAGYLLVQGYFRDDSWSWTKGAILYVSGTTGEITSTIPSGSGQVVQILGYARTATEIHFRPSYDTVEIK